MTTPSNTYSLRQDAESRLEPLKAAYADRPEAGRKKESSSPARNFIHAASQFQATLLTAVTHNRGTPLITAFGDAAIDRSNSAFSLKAQLEIASQRPEVYRALTGMLDAHQAYTESKPVPLTRRLLSYVGALVR